MESTRWLVNIHQKYGMPESEKYRRSTLIVTLSLKAMSAQGAMCKASSWLKKSEIEDAFVQDVNPVDIPEVEVDDEDKGHSTLGKSTRDDNFPL